MLYITNDIEGIADNALVPCDKCYSTEDYCDGLVSTNLSIFEEGAVIMKVDKCMHTIRVMTITL